jgi:hypothetical protein
MILEGEYPIEKIFDIKEKCDVKFECGYGYYQITEKGKLYDNSQWNWWTSLDDDLKNIREDQLLWLMTDEPVDPDIIKIKLITQADKNHSLTAKWIHFWEK